MTDRPQPFPNITMALTEARTKQLGGFITQPWRDLLETLWLRTGGAVGPTVGPQGFIGLTGFGDEGDGDGAIIPGPPGAAGPQGPMGPSGLRGPPGEDGAQGDDGSIGAPGAPGPAGATGPAGPAGAVGLMLAGLDGQDGDDGAPIPGIQGPQGATGPAGASGALVLITEIVTSGSQASVTFSSIPNTYRDLIVRVRGRGDASATNVTIQMTFNGDTGTNYDIQYLEGSPSAGAGNFFSLNNISFSRLPGATAPANNAGGTDVIIFDYRGTTFYKSVSVSGGAIFGTSGSTTLTGQYVGDWRNTAAITSVKIALSAGNFVNNSVVSLYGSY